MTKHTEIHKSQLLCTKQHLVLLVMFIPANSSPFFWCKQKSQKQKKIEKNVTWYFPFVITATCCLNSFISFCSFFYLEFYMHSIIQIQRVFLKLYTAVCEVGWCLNWFGCFFGLCNIFVTQFHIILHKMLWRHTLIKHFIYLYNT